MDNKLMQSERDVSEVLAQIDVHSVWEPDQVDLRSML